MKNYTNNTNKNVQLITNQQLVYLHLTLYKLGIEIQL